MSGLGTRLYLAVALGSAAGALARHGVSLGALAVLGPGFPWGTLTANVLGSWLMGYFAARTGPGTPRPVGPATQYLVLGGFCGGFTTFSIFSLEAWVLYLSAGGLMAGLYVGVSVLLWLSAVWIGYRMGRPR